MEAIAEVDISALETFLFAGLGAAGSSLLSFFKTVAQERLKDL
jgi:hypothetical protein